MRIRWPWAHRTGCQATALILAALILASWAPRARADVGGIESDDGYSISLAPTPGSGSTFLHTYFVTVQVGGDEAWAGPDLSNAAEAVLWEELQVSEEYCHVLELWNVSTCLDGGPAPALSPILNLTSSGEEAYHANAPSLMKAGPDPVVQTTAYYSEAKSPSQGLRRLKQVSSGLAPGAAEDAPLGPAVSPPCKPQAEFILELKFEDEDAQNKCNETVMFFTNGGYLARMQALNISLEQAKLVNFQESTSTYKVPGTGTVTYPDLFSFTPQPGIWNKSFTALEFSFNIVGDDAQVTNDTVLRALFSTVVQPSNAGAASKWLNGPNTAITDVRQGLPQQLDTSQLGRKLLQSDHLHTTRRRLSQSSYGLDLPLGTPSVGAAPNRIVKPSLDVTFRIQAAPRSEATVIKDVVSTLVTSNRVLQQLRSQGIKLLQVSLTSFNFQAGPGPQPPAAPSPSAAISTATRNSNDTVAKLVLAIVLPVGAVILLALGVAVWWIHRLKIKRGEWEEGSRLKSKGTGTSYLSSRSKGSEVTDLEEVGALMQELHPPNLSQSRLMDMPWSDWKIEPSELTILTKPDGQKWLLGSGASGTVYKALRNGVQIVAVKMFNEEATKGAITSLNSWAHAMQFRQEISILKSCHDRNIVQFLGACLTAGQTSLVTEFLENGDLYRAINSQQGARYHWYRMQSPDGRAVPNSGMARRVALDVARGLHFLHNKKIVHFDLKSANILLARDFTAKIADVGLAKILHDDVLSTRREVGTFAWAAPEVLLGQHTNEAADIYSFGVLLHELSALESPRGRQLRSLAIPEEVPAEISELIYRCLDVRPENRPTARDLVAALACMPALPPLAPQPCSGQ